MKLAMIGFGQAGGKIVDKFLEYDERTGSGIVRSAVAVNTAKADLLGLDRIPQENRVLIGQARVKGHGVGADNELGAEIAEEDIDEIQGAIDNIPVHEIDAFLIVAGLGGGTGSGGSPVLAKHLKRIYTEPVYGLGILPGSDEGGIYTLNAARSFQTFVREVDNLLVFDNDAWRKTGESMESGYAEINDDVEVVRRVDVVVAVRADVLLSQTGRRPRAVGVHLPANPDGFVAFGRDDDPLMDVERPPVVAREVVHVRRVRDEHRVQPAFGYPLFRPGDSSLVLAAVEDPFRHGNGSLAGL